jgi:hypothetical protein
MNSKLPLLIALIIALLIILFTSFQPIVEKFTPNEVQTVTPTERGKLGGTGFPEKNLNGFINATKPSVSQILYDPTFQDVVVYNNDDNPYETGQSNGVDKCLSHCNGKCVEFGVSGIGFCYPETRGGIDVNQH